MERRLSLGAAAFTDRGPARPRAGGHTRGGHGLGARPRSRHHGGHGLRSRLFLRRPLLRRAREELVRLRAECHTADLHGPCRCFRVPGGAVQYRRGGPVLHRRDHRDMARPPPRSSRALCNSPHLRRGGGHGSRSQRGSRAAEGEDRCPRSGYHDDVRLRGAHAFPDVHPGERGRSRRHRPPGSNGPGFPAGLAAVVQGNPPVCQLSPPRRHHPCHCLRVPRAFRPRTDHHRLQDPGRRLRSASRADRGNLRGERSRSSPCSSRACSRPLRA